MQMGWLEHMALKFAPALCRAIVFQGCLYFQKLRGGSRKFGALSLSGWASWVIQQVTHARGRWWQLGPQ